MPPLPLRTCPAWARSAISRASRISSDSAAAASIAGGGILGSLARRRRGSGGCSGLRRLHRQLVFAALGPQLDLLRLAPHRHPALSRFGAEAVEEIVGVRRVVVEEDRALGAGAVGEGERVTQRRVSPADVVGILGVGVLAVVDQQRGIAGERTV